MLTFLCYPRCTTCKRARDFLDKREISYDERDICTENPTRDELEAWLKISGIDFRRMFTSGGPKARELGLKSRLPEMTQDEALDLLATDGMLVRRPVLVGDDFALFGFMESEWNEKCGM